MPLWCILIDLLTIFYIVLIAYNITFLSLGEKYYIDSNLKQHPLIISVSIGHKSAGLSWVLCLGSHKTKMEVLARMSSHLKTLGKNSFPSLFRSLAAFSSLGSWDQSPHFLAGCQPGTTVSIYKLLSPWVWPSIASKADYPSDGLWLY